jgi:hypothetical protein
VGSEMCIRDRAGIILNQFGELFLGECHFLRRELK